MKRREQDRATRGAKDYRLLWAGLLLLVALIFVCVGFSCGRIRRGLKNAADAEMAETTSENAAMLLSLIHISEPTRHICLSRMPASA